MFQVKNTRTGKIVKDAITCRPLTFDNIERAEYLAKSLARNSVLNATAWNTTRPTKYVVVTA